jgi:hypothetical protein
MSTALNFVVGLSLGYFIGSILESVLHEYVSDAPKHFVETWRRYPRLFRVMINTRFSHHVVHHYLTFRTNHVTQFTSREERERLEALLLARGRHGRIIIAGQFANKLHAEGGFIFALPSILSGVALGMFAPASLAIGAAMTLSLPPLFSYFIHPYLHMSFNEARRGAPPLTAWLLQTRYVKAMYVNHYMHHRYGGTSNYNLVLGADYLRRRMRKPSGEDVIAMKAIGLPV